ncbi:substrate-binding domain-containing protein [Defluviitalea raffinosedens]|uniref:Substrate-binding domain-containing protein n=1 Tax=Defluviitalea raffinosedens TaxID=1450156 RepID=A0A7C8HEU8_9FIRM|nr:sugar ABC transporter substrate-binding protein [Defluviitalea raffinosedens]KAE9632058.1 substrate-binding domain-containing protein [Defluviitalea raffinosedens]
MKRKFFSMMMVVAMVASLFAGCGNSTSTTSTSKTDSTATSGSEKAADNKSSEDKIKIAVIRNLPSDDHTKQFLDGAVSEGQSLGYQVDTFISNGDDAKFQELVAQQIEKDYDGFVISHGKAEYSTEMLQPALNKGIKIVTFDTSFKDGVIPEGITSTAQDDYSLAKLSLDEIVARSANKPARVIKLWYGPGVPPLDRREEIYKQYEAEGKIQTLELIGPSTLDDVQGEVSSRVGAILAKYPEGSVDAIWGSWDELAKGGYKALQEANRKDIQLISIDISNQDINLMMEPDSIWKATAAVDPRLIGMVNMRILAKKLKGEETPQTYDLAAHLIKQEDLNADTTMDTLKQVVPGWGESDAFNEPWMDELRSQNGK